MPAYYLLNIVFLLNNASLVSNVFFYWLWIGVWLIALYVSVQPVAVAALHIN